MNNRLVKKILYIHYSGSIGGAPVSLLHLAQSLEKAKYLPIIIFSEEGPILNFFRCTEIDFKVVPFKSAFFYGAQFPIRLRMLWKFVVYFVPTILTMQRLIQKEKPDLIHLNTSVLIPCALVAKIMNVPIVWHIREVCGNNRLIRRLMLTTIERLADKIIAVSDTVKKQFGKKRKVVRIYNAVDFNQFDNTLLKQRDSIRKELGIPKDAQVVAMVGGVQYPKGHFVFLNAAEMIIKRLPNIIFLIVAGGVPEGYARSWKGKIKKLLGMPFGLFEQFVAEVEKRGLTSNFIFTGYRKDIPRIMAAIDILVFPVLQAEGFGRPLIEAMAMEKPVIASAIGPSSEIVKDGITGLLVPPSDAASLAKASLELLKDKDKMQTMGNAGRQQARAAFSMEKNVSDTINVYREILETT